MNGNIPTAVIWAKDFNIGSFDNCTEQTQLLYTFDKVPPVLDKIDQVHCFDETGAEVPCSQYENGYPIQRWDPATGTSGTKLIGTTWCGKNLMTVSVWDEKFNTDFCEATLVVSGEACENLAGQNTTVAGIIETEDGDRVPNVEVHLMTTDPDYPKDQMTNIDGIYSFYDNPHLMNYTISPTKDGDDLNGVSTLDILFIQKHILGIETLGSPYKMIAADINADERITGIDIVELRKLILGVYSEFPETDSWVFVDKSSPMIDNHPWPFMDEITLYGLDQNYVDEDFIAIKMGDVNGTATANISGITTDNRSSNSIDLILSRTGNSIEFKAGANFNAVHGFQFALKGATNLQAVKPAALRIGMQHFASNRDKLVCSFDSKSLIDFAEGELLFTIDLIDIANVVSLETEIVSPEIYLETTLETSRLNVIVDALVNDYALKNTPNPFSEMTEISFSLPKSEDAQIRVFDLAGRMLFTHKEYYTKGTHTLNIDAGQLGEVKGVYFYELKTKSFTELKRMMLVD